MNHDDFYSDYFNNHLIVLDDIRNDICLINEDTAVIRVVRKNGDIHYVYIDSGDAPKCSQYTWRVKQNNNTYYAYTSIRKSDGSYFTTTIHRLIMFDNPIESDSDIMIDHINRNGLDNRRSNLRYCDNRKNQWNSRVSSSNTTGYTGVSYTAPLNRYLAQMKLPDGTFLWKSYSCGRRGKEKAFEMTVKQRLEWEKTYHVWD